jgi:hypothetical protein
MALNPVRSRSVVVQANFRGVRHNIIQIGFLKDGSLVIHFPYFKHRTGLLSVVTAPPMRTAEVSLAPGGKCTSHLVKYTHHVDGEAHFSQDKKVVTLVRRRAVPIHSLRGHIFTVEAQGLNAFDPATRTKDLSDPTSRRANILMGMDNQGHEAIKIVGMVYRSDQLRIYGDAPDQYGPIIPIKNDDYGLMQGVTISNPHDNSDRTLLVLFSRTMPSLNNSGIPIMRFTGGFDPDEVVLDHCCPVNKRTNPIG